MGRLSVRGILGAVLGTGAWLITCTSLAHAHGGMVGPDELGPPVAISAGLGISGYWLMMLWPGSRRRRANGQAPKQMMRREGHGKRYPARS
jgi:hypothetical protein